MSPDVPTAEALRAVCTAFPRMMLCKYIKNSNSDIPCFTAHCDLSPFVKLCLLILASEAAYPGKRANGNIENADAASIPRWCRRDDGWMELRDERARKKGHRVQNFGNWNATRTKRGKVEKLIFVSRAFACLVCAVGTGRIPDARLGLAWLDWPTALYVPIARCENARY